MADGPRWLARQEAEHDNLRAALEWADATGQVELQLRMLGALTLFFELRAHLGEGGRWFARALGADAAPSPIRCPGLVGRGPCRRVWRGLCDRLHTRGAGTRDQSRARRLPCIGHRWLIALADHSLAQVARQQQQAHRAQALLHDALGLRVANKWLPGVVDSLEALAELAAEQQCLLEAPQIPDQNFQRLRIECRQKVIDVRQRRPHARCAHLKRRCAIHGIDPHHGFDPSPQGAHFEID